jgi:hypothetical protein
MTRSQRIMYGLVSTAVLIPWAAAASYICYVTWGHPNFGWHESLLVPGFMWFGFAYAVRQLWKHYAAAQAFSDRLR